jgi:hypothetical protein
VYHFYIPFSAENSITISTQPLRERELVMMSREMNTFGNNNNKTKEGRTKN